MQQEVRRVFSAVVGAEWGVKYHVMRINTSYFCKKESILDLYEFDLGWFTSRLTSTPYQKHRVHMWNSFQHV